MNNDPGQNIIKMHPVMDQIMILAPNLWWMDGWSAPGGLPPPTPPTTP
jgi:hypothetical protein